MIFSEHKPAEQRRLRPLLRCVTMLAFATLAFASGSGRARAQSCSATVTGGAYGTINVLTGSAIPSSTSLAISCAGTPGKSVRLCVEIEPGTVGTAGQRIMSGPGATLNHEIFSDPGRTRAWGSWALTGTGYGSGGLQVDLNLGASTGTATQILTLYDMISASQTTALPGDYVWTGTAPGLSYAYFDGRSCPVAGIKQISSLSWTWTATVAPYCLISVADINFGTWTGLASGASGTGRVDLRCTRSTSYMVALDGGTAQAAAPSARLMTNGASTIPYALYSDSGLTQPWGWTAGRDTFSGTGTGILQSLIVYGRIPAQRTPEIGRYADRVVVSLTY